MGVRRPPTLEHSLPLTLMASKWSTASENPATSGRADMRRMCKKKQCEKGTTYMEERIVSCSCFRCWWLDASCRRRFSDSMPKFALKLRKTWNSSSTSTLGKQVNIIAAAAAAAAPGHSQQGAEVGLQLLQAGPEEGCGHVQKRQTA